MDGSGWELVGLNWSGWEWMGGGGSRWEWVRVRFSIIQIFICENVWRKNFCIFWYIEHMSWCIVCMFFLFISDISELVFLTFFLTEMFLKLYGLGPRKYFRSKFNKFDCVVSVYCVESVWLYSNCLLRKGPIKRSLLFRGSSII